MNHNDVVRWVLAQIDADVDGGTVRVADGHVPTRGFVVGGVSDVSFQRVPELAYLSAENDLTEEIVRIWVDLYWETIRRHHIGIWKSDNRDFVLDCVEVRHTSWSALNAAKARNEDAVYDLGTNREIPANRTILAISKAALR